jgi:saccharopine dehydrogenase (NAD+, L-lysine forming)
MRGAVLEDEPACLTRGSATAAMEHWLIQVSGTIRVCRNGVAQDIEPLQPVDLERAKPGRGRQPRAGARAPCLS